MTGSSVLRKKYHNLCKRHIFYFNKLLWILFCILRKSMLENINFNIFCIENPCIVLCTLTTKHRQRHLCLQLQIYLLLRFQLETLEYKQQLYAKLWKVLSPQIDYNIFLDSRNGWEDAYVNAQDWRHYRSVRRSSRKNARNRQNSQEQFDDLRHPTWLFARNPTSIGKQSQRNFQTQLVYRQRYPCD